MESDTCILTPDVLFGISLPSSGQLNRTESNPYSSNSSSSSSSTKPVSRTKLRRHMNVSAYPRISNETRLSSILSVLTAQGYSSDTNSILAVQTAHALEQFVFVSADGEYMHKVQLCLNYLRQACGTITDLLTERPSLWSLQKRLQENAIQQRDVFHRWIEERNILEREITQDMLVGNENVSARMDEDSYCHRCHSRRISAETKQMRKADEGATTIFRCLECQHTWRKSA